MASSEEGRIGQGGAGDARNDPRAAGVADDPRGAVRAAGAVDENAPGSSSCPVSPRYGGAISKRIWAVAGLAAFGLGCVGVALPVIPTTPFVLLAAFCFARSSERLDRWFHGTKLYEKVLKDYVAKRSMTMRAKLTVLVPVTVLMALAAFFMRRLVWGPWLMLVIWLAHFVYFGLVVKTDRAGE